RDFHVTGVQTCALPISVLPRMKDGRQAFFLFLPEGEDPDTIVRNEGAAGFDARLAQAVPLSQYLFDSLSEDGINLATLDGKARRSEQRRVGKERRAGPA